MVAGRLPRRANIETTLVRCIVFAEYNHLISEEPKAHIYM